MTSNEICSLLKQTYLFRDIDTLDTVIGKYPPEIVEIPCGDEYVVENSVVFIISGKADIVKSSANRNAYLKTAKSMSVLGFATLFDEKREYISTLIAKSDMKVALFSEGFITALIQSSPDFSIKFVKNLCDKVRYLNKRIDFYTSGSAEGKLHEFLVHSCNEVNQVTMPMSKISDTLGIGRASLYRSLSSLEERGFIVKDGKKIILLK